MAHLLMLHGHPVGYLPPTMASEILYDNNNTVKDKLDEALTYKDDDSGIAITFETGFTKYATKIQRVGNVIFISLRFDVSSITTGQEKLTATFSGIDTDNALWLSGNICANSNSLPVGSWAFSTKKLYTNFTSTAYSRVGLSLIIPV